ncbi:MAG TPA: exonuclease SbcCD subunit D [Mycobacteriales bacterium]|nr:exonuclease SbcCD subunit D [Mycobacteriales bacterium]
MRFLHTSDWHVGKVLKGHSRLAEQAAVLDEIAGIARDQAVDAVLIAGDLYESAAPSAEAQQLVVRTLLRLRRTGAEVVAMAGNHDHADTFDAYRPLLAEAGITLIGRVRGPDRGGVVEFTARSTGEPVRIAVLPFLSQRYAVHAAELITQTPAENSARYDQLVRDLIRALTAGFTGDAVNLIMAHLTVTNGTLGGGERAAQTIFEYHVPATAFPAEAHYVALGHLHRRQSLPAPCPVHYSGSPLAVDFGEVDNKPVVLVVAAGVGTPAGVTEVPVTAARQLRILRGSLADLSALAGSLGDAYLRVFVREPARAGLREQVQELLPNALEVLIDPEFAARPSRSGPAADGVERSPGELFGEFCAQRGVADPPVEALFARLHDQIIAAEG